MKKFKIKDLLVSLPTDAKKAEFKKNCAARTLLCYQVTLPNCREATYIDPCKGGKTMIPCDYRTIIDCKQVTIPDCKKHTLIDICNSGRTYIPCDSRTYFPCNKVTIPDCKDETIIDICDGGKTLIPCESNTYLPCRVTLPDCRNSFIDVCNGRTTFDTIITRNITDSIKEMDLDELGSLKEEMRFLLQEVEKEEDKFIPDDLEDIDALEKELKKSLEALQEKRTEIKKKKK